MISCWLFAAPSAQAAAAQMVQDCLFLLAVCLYAAMVRDIAAEVRG